MFTESNIIPANSSFVVPLYLCATSGIPTSPKNKVSPVKTANSFSFSSFNKKEVNSLELTAAFNFSKNWSVGFKFIHDIEEEKNVSNVFSIDYENDGLIVGIAYMKILELDWVSILENDYFKDYHKDRIRLFFELKGLGSIGRPKENYLIRRSL